MRGAGLKTIKRAMGGGERKEGRKEGRERWREGGTNRKDFSLRRCHMATGHWGNLRVEEVKERQG